MRVVAGDLDIAVAEVERRLWVRIALKK